MNKKQFGLTVKGILSTATECFVIMGEDDLEAIVNLMNSAYLVAAMWDLKEINDIEEYKNSLNRALASDDSDYRIINDDRIYKVVKLV